MKIKLELIKEANMKVIVVYKPCDNGATILRQFARYMYVTMSQKLGINNNTHTTQKSMKNVLTILWLVQIGRFSYTERSCSELL